MRPELCATVGDREISVEIESSGGHWLVRLDGRELRVDAERIKEGTWSVLVGERSYLVDVAASSRGSVVHTHGAETQIVIESALRKRLAATVGGRSRKEGGDEVVVAPIAGRLVKFLVEAGERVEAGQGVAVLEAMKMENEIKAERGGEVLTLHGEAGGSIETGERLLVLREAKD